MKPEETRGAGKAPKQHASPLAFNTPVGPMAPPRELSDALSKKNDLELTRLYVERCGTHVDPILYTALAERGLIDRGDRHRDVVQRLAHMEREQREPREEPIDLGVLDADALHTLLMETLVHNQRDTVTEGALQQAEWLRHSRKVMDMVELASPNEELMRQLLCYRHPLSLLMRHWEDGEVLDQAVDRIVEAQKDRPYDLASDRFYDSWGNGPGIGMT